MGFNLNELAFNCLKAHKDAEFSVTGLAQLVFDTYPDRCAENRKNRTTVYPTDKAFVSQLAAEIGAHRKKLLDHSGVKVLGKPRKYVYDPEFGMNGEVEQLIEESSTQTQVGNSDEKSKLSEFDLYPILFDYVRGEFDVRAKRIDEKKSTKTGGKGWNDWLHPDLVGFEVFEEDWVQEVQKCLKKSNGRRFRVWSFEVKRALDGANVRKAFFQAVSNSSWANLGYLVASEIEDPAREQLRILSQLHGIGVIELNIKEPSNSDVFLPAHEKQALDWESINRLAKENSDFREFLENIRHFLETDDIKDSDWSRP
jgi:hypothetical protein